MIGSILNHTPKRYDRFTFGERFFQDKMMPKKPPKSIKFGSPTPGIFKGNSWRGNSHIKPLEKSVECSLFGVQAKIYRQKQKQVLYNMKGVMMLPNKGLNYDHLLIHFRYIYIFTLVNQDMWFFNCSHRCEATIMIILGLVAFVLLQLQPEII